MSVQRYQKERAETKEKRSFLRRAGRSVLDILSKPGRADRHKGRAWACRLFVWLFPGFWSRSVVLIEVSFDAPLGGLFKLLVVDFQPAYLTVSRQFFVEGGDVLFHLGFESMTGHVGALGILDVGR